MDNVENQVPAQSDLDELRAECESLRHLVGSVMVLVLVISGTLNLYLWRQFRTTRAELAVYGPQARNLIASYQKNDGPGIENFLRRIVEYGRTHPDFAPILAKYGINPAAAPGTAPAAATPPATSPPAVVNPPATASPSSPKKK